MSYSQRRTHGTVQSDEHIFSTFTQQLKPRGSLLVFEAKRKFL
jgi:hypothetical protein